MEKKLHVYILSDSLGDTAEMVARAAAEQFKGVDYEIHKYPFANNDEQIIDIIEEAKEFQSIVVFTTVVSEIREQIVEECEKAGIPYSDIMRPIMKVFEKTLEIKPVNEPGLIHKMDERYFKRVEAVEFAVKYDDGKDPRGILKADLVLLGVSRTSKTPLSMYLAHKNLKVANVPLVPEVPIPDELFSIPTQRIVGLTNDPMRLNEIRQERLKAMGLSDNAIYANPNRIFEELEYAEGVMRRIKCPVINVSHKAVEETANMILEILKRSESLEV